MGRVEGKVAFITGAARGQGRSHAVRLAEEGADVIVIDTVDQLATVNYPMATSADLAETVRQVEAVGGRIIATQADVRNYDAVAEAVDRGVAELGRLDIVSANAGIVSAGKLEELTEQQWDEMIDVNLKGAWHTAKATIPALRKSGGGSMILTSSAMGLKSAPHLGHYASAKHGLVGLMRTLALELAPDNIRVNTIHPTNVNTPMLINDEQYSMFAPDLQKEERTDEALIERFKQIPLMDIPYVESIDVSHALLWLASDESRFVTGVTLPVDGGQLVL
ncbi:mycofactocin-coupled SDR family oxidoreductase [Mycolicibacterium sp.]|uniref:mycofactocin-coupled SDR family oxidoreductase n=1 Tax=Mycolicibacterium sp. TaxID=2320850 RepID=UPI0037C94702